MKSTLGVLRRIVGVIWMFSIWAIRKFLIPALIIRWILNNPKKILSGINWAKEKWSRV